MERGALESVQVLPRNFVTAPLFLLYETWPLSLCSRPRSLRQRWPFSWKCGHLPAGRGPRASRGQCS